jgi:hypothetical protein
MYQAEHELGEFLRPSADLKEADDLKKKADDLKKAAMRDALQSLNIAEGICPGMPWQASFRGRLLLLEAIRRALTVRVNIKDRALGREPGFDDERVRRELRRELAEADRLLRIATAHGDDPIAALAHARVIQLRASLERK